LPARTTALLLDPLPGQELTCHAHSAQFGEAGRTIEQGVISYYAARTLPTARNASGWLHAMMAHADADVEAGRLPADRRLRLKLAGDVGALLPGRPAAPTGAGR